MENEAMRTNEEEDICRATRVKKGALKVFAAGKDGQNGNFFFFLPLC
jgi:hypothetical protein